MKAIILAVLMAGPALAGDLTFKVGGAEYRLTDQPCRVASANEAIKAEFAGQQRAGWHMTKERTIAFCWLARSKWIDMIACRFQCRRGESAPNLRNDSTAAYRPAQARKPAWR